MLQLHLDHLDAVNAAIARIDKEVDANVEPFRVAIEMLTTIPGVSSLAAEVMVSEISIDMSRFKTEGHRFAPSSGVAALPDPLPPKQRRLFKLLLNRCRI
jgi:transposase